MHSTGGTRLAEFLAGLPIKKQWTAGHHIVWQTGQQNGPDNAGRDDHTHCSALVAAIALYLDIYILRPPNHQQQLLANAQIDWLTASRTFAGPSAKDSGWTALGCALNKIDLESAVAAANMGKLVVAGYRQPSDATTGHTRPGHIVIVRPQSPSFCISDGPLVAMAGQRNWYSIHMKAAFDAHPGAWPCQIHLFAHDTDLETEVPASEGAA